MEKQKVEMSEKTIDALKKYPTGTFPEGHNYERQMTTVPSESVSSVEIKQTTKGTTFTVKVYDADPDVAKLKATELFNNLSKKYPQVDK